VTTPVPGGPPLGIPDAEVEIDERVVRDLLRDQHPDLADRPLRLVATGWDNFTYRLGDDLAVRLPRIHAAVALIRNEQRWLPALAPDLPLPVPAPVRVGEPGGAFPWPWSVVPWIPGRSAEHEPPAAAEAARFGAFLSALHRPAPDDFPRNDWRGVHLAAVAERVDERLRRLAAKDTGLAPSLAEVARRWTKALAAPRDALATRVHADLHPKNLVVDGGRLVAVLDWGDLTAGDPAVDLSAAWMLFPAAAHGALRAAYGHVPADTEARTIGWALFFGVTLLDVGLTDDPLFADIGRRTLARLCESPEPAA
jgi:aminoglycoside phosphotransferase (APT) family kinase protein